MKRVDNVVRAAVVRNIVVAAGFCVTAAFTAAPALAADSAKGRSTDPLVARGRYLVQIAGCNDCHTPLKVGPKGPEPDLARFLSGHPEQMGSLPATAAQGPWLWSGAATRPVPIPSALTWQEILLDADDEGPGRLDLGQGRPHRPAVLGHVEEIHAPR